jgi:GTP-binding protein EngB required for normal cell division
MTDMNQVREVDRQSEECTESTNHACVHRRSRPPSVVLGAACQKLDQLDQLLRADPAWIAAEATRKRQAAEQVTAESTAIVDRPATVTEHATTSSRVNPHQPVQRVAPAHDLSYATVASSSVVRTEHALASSSHPAAGSSSVSRRAAAPSNSTAGVPRSDRGEDIHGGSTNASGGGGQARRNRQQRADDGHHSQQLTRATSRSSSAAIQPALVPQRGLFAALRDTVSRASGSLVRTSAPWFRALFHVSLQYGASSLHCASTMVQGLGEWLEDTFHSLPWSDVLSHLSPSTVWCHPMQPGEFHIVVLGKTGSGKSTLINLLGSYFQLDASQLTPEAILIPRSKAQSRSVTSVCQAYRLVHPKYPRTTFVLHDTPGYGDSGGVQQDEINAKHMLAYMKTMTVIRAVVLVIDGQRRDELTHQAKVHAASSVLRSQLTYACGRRAGRLMSTRCLLRV